MKTKYTIKKHIILVICLIATVTSFAQSKEVIPDLSKCNNTSLWNLQNRSLSIKEKELMFNGQPGAGLLWSKTILFENGEIELDIKGKDAKGKSFVGLAFHGIDGTTYDAIYFRPFNFQNPQKQQFSMQYISQPQHTWNSLRKKHFGVYENPIGISLDPNEWFHVRIVVNYPSVKVFVNNAEEPSLSIKQLSAQKKGWIGFWLGNRSEGAFKNLKITPSK